MKKIIFVIITINVILLCSMSICIADDVSMVELNEERGLTNFVNKYNQYISLDSEFRLSKSFERYDPTPIPYTTTYYSVTSHEMHIFGTVNDNGYIVAIVVLMPNYYSNIERWKVYKALMCAANPYGDREMQLISKGYTEAINDKNGVGGYFSEAANRAYLVTLKNSNSYYAIKITAYAI